MRYIRFLTIAGLILSAVGFCNAELTNLPNGISTADPYEIMQGTTTVLGTMGAGDLFVQDDLQVVGKVDMRETETKVDIWTDLAAKSTAYYFYHIAVDTATAVGGIYYIRGSEFKNQCADSPRNMQIFVDSDTAAGAAPILSAAIQGRDGRGNIVTETIAAISTTTASVGVRGYWTIYGASITIVAPACRILALAIGTGDVISLQGDIDETNDVNVMVKGAVYYKAEDGLVTVNAANDTWTHSDVPDGADDYVVIYKVNTEARNAKGTNNHPY